MTEKDLKENIKSFIKSARLVYATKDYTSATLLYFKALFATLDLIIFRTFRKTPKDHSERFQLLKSSFPELYEILDKIYPVYRDTYSLRIEKEVCDRIKKDVENVIKKYKIFE
jgi:uncharacterized protein (UPF0332 family)